jgi:spore maturation protein CgeB
VRFLIPNNRGPDTFVDNVADALETMGHEVATLPPVSVRVMNSHAFNIARKLQRRLFGAGLTMVERKAIRVAREFRPDVVLALTQQFGEAALAELRKAGARALVAWWGDPPANMGEMGLLSDQWDRIWIKDPDGARKLRRVGLRAELLHEAANPRWHRPVAARANDDLVLAGHYYGYRLKIVERLVRSGVPFALYGGRPPAWAAPEVARHHTGRYVVREEKSRVFGEALAVLNTTSLAEGNSLNCRAFEVAAAGGLQLLERRPIASECFEPGSELLDFDSWDELLAQLDRVRRFPAEADSIRAAAAKRAAAEHTYRHRLEVILADLAK